MNTVEQWKQLLENSVCTVVYFNKSGERSEREITLNPSLINYKYKQNDHTEKKDTDSIVAWDCAMSVWRRFKINNLSLATRNAPNNDHIQAIPNGERAQQT
jgi:hypothetical protein